MLTRAAAFLRNMAVPMHANLSLLSGLYWPGFSPMCFRSILGSESAILARRAVLEVVYNCTHAFLVERSITARSVRKDTICRRSGSLDHCGYLCTRLATSRRAPCLFSRVLSLSRIMDPQKQTVTRLNAVDARAAPAPHPQEPARAAAAYSRATTPDP